MEAEKLGLEMVRAPLFNIIYGNSSKSVSDQAVWLSCKIKGRDHGGFYVRVVTRQNITTIFGMNWLLKRRVLIDPLYKELIPQSWVSFSEHYVNMGQVTLDETQIHLLEGNPNEIVEILLIQNL